jgi:tetratricopeptide (TPR) repeat protein
VIPGFRSLFGRRGAAVTPATGARDAYKRAAGAATVREAEAAFEEAHRHLSRARDGDGRVPGELQLLTVQILTDMALFHGESRSLRGACKAFAEAVGVLEGAQSPLIAARATLLMALARVARHQGELAVAWNAAQEAFRLLALDSQSSGPEASRFERAQVLVELGGIAVERGQHEQARVYFETLVNQYRKAGDTSSPAHARAVDMLRSVCRGQAELRRSLQEPRVLLLALDPTDDLARDTTMLLEIMAVLETAAALAAPGVAELPIDEAWQRGQRATRSIEEGDLDAARAGLQDALTALERLAPASPAAATVLGDLGFLELRQGRGPDAVQHLERATRLLERLRARVGGPAAREHFAAHFHRVYERLVMCLPLRAQTGHAVQAEDLQRTFEVAELARARGLHEFLDRETPSEVKRGEAATRRTVAALRAELRRARPHGARDADSRRRIAELEAQLRLEDSRLERQQVRDLDRLERAGHRPPAALTLAEIQRDVVEADTLMVAYAVTDALVFTWFVRRDAFEAGVLSVSRPSLAGRIGSVIGTYHDKAIDAGESGRALAGIRALLPADDSPLWSGVRRVLVVPEDALYYLPFEMLLVNGRPLGDAYAVAYAPSVTTLRLLRRREQARAQAEADFVGFADPADPDDQDRGAGAESEPALPSLAGARAEVDAIASLFPRHRVFVGPDATVEQVRASTAGHRYVHFATHAIIDDEDPFDSGLVLARSGEARDGGRLRAWEMFDLDLDADLVVCSACRTALGQPRPGEGIVGLARALFHGGAGCVVLSLWSVPDHHTAQLMKWFYEDLVAGRDIAEALRQARARMRIAEPDPYYWAGFVAIGAAW